MNDPTFQIPNVGVLVEGSPTGPRLLAHWRNLLDAYADCEIDTDHEAYLSHFAFTDAMIARTEPMRSQTPSSAARVIRP